MSSAARRRVCLLSLRSDQGGGPRHLDLLLRYGMRMGGGEWEWFVAAPLDAPYGPGWKAEVGGERFFPMPARRFRMRSLFGLRRFLEERGVSLLHSHGKGAGLYSRLLKLLMPGLRVVHTFHGLHYGHLPRLKAAAYLCWERMASLATDVSIHVSPSEYELARGLHLHLPGGCKAVVILNGVEDADCARRDRGTGRGEGLRVVTLSRFDAAKNMGEALEIAAASPHMRFVWIGDGPERGSLEAEAAERGIRNVSFLGFRSDVHELLSTADVYLSTSRWEGLPLSLLEACRAGVPIVASRVCGNVDVVEHGVNGFLYSSGDVAGAVSWLKRLEADEKMRLEMGLAARKVFERRFKVDKMVEETLGVYNVFLR